MYHRLLGAPPVEPVHLLLVGLGSLLLCCVFGRDPGASVQVLIHMVA